MKDRQRLFLEKVVNLLVGDTRINYEKKKIHFPFFLDIPSYLSHLLPTTPLSLPFSNYCKNQFGLTDEEIDYVWDQYKDIMAGKLNNNER